MRIRRLIAVLALPLALAACDREAVSPEPPLVEVAGLWVSEFAAQSGFNYVDTVSFGPGERYARTFRSYRGTDHSTLFGRHTTEGTYRVRGDRLELRVTRRGGWQDQIGEFPEVTDPRATWVEAGTLRAGGGTLDITYVSYLNDGPTYSTITYSPALQD